VASDFDFQGPGVVKPHPKKNWVNPDARQVAFPSGASRRRSGPSRERSGPSREPSGPSREPSGPSTEPSGPSREPSGPSRTRTGRSLLQILAALFGLVFLLGGVGGFIPGVTSNYAELELFGTDSKAELLGLFRISILHNIVHLLFGVGLLAAASAAASRAYLIGGGVVYLGVAAYGFVVDKESDANFLPLNDTDNLLHVGLSLGMIAAGVLGTALDRKSSRA